MGDIDFREQFMNFILHEKVRRYARVDVTPFFPELVDSTKYVLWLHWERCGMGLVFKELYLLKKLSGVIMLLPTNQQNI